MAKGFHNDTHALTSLQAQAKFVREHIDLLRKVKGGDKLEEHVQNAWQFLRIEQLPPGWMMTKLEQAYEKVIAALYKVDEANLLKRKWTGFR